MNATRKPPDRARLAAWAGAALVGGSLLLAGLVWKPAPDLEVRLESARLYARMGMFAEARREVGSILADHPAHPEASLLLGVVAFCEGRLAEALFAYRDGRPLIEGTGDPAKLSDLHVTTGLLHLALGDFAEAEADAAAVLVLGRRPAAGFLIEAFSRLGAADDTGFRSGLRRAWAADPWDPLFHLPGDFLVEAQPWAPAFVSCGFTGRVPRD